MKVLLVLISLIKVGEFLDCSNHDTADVLLKIRRKILCNYDKDITPINDQDKPIEMYFNYIFKKFRFVSYTSQVELEAVDFLILRTGSNPTFLNKIIINKLKVNNVC